VNDSRQYRRRPVLGSSTLLTIELIHLMNHLLTYLHADGSDSKTARKKVQHIHQRVIGN